MKRQILVLGTLVLLSTLCSASGLLQEPAKKGKKNRDETMWVVASMPTLPTLPTNVTHHKFRSASMKCDVGYCIYLPPGYEKRSAGIPSGST